LAKIVRIDRLDDGRMNLLVMGASRFQIVGTADDRPYLRGQIRIIPEAGDDLDATARLTETTAMAFQQYSNLLRELVGQKADEAEPPMEAGAALLPDRGSAEPAGPRETNPAGGAAYRFSAPTGAPHPAQGDPAPQADGRPCRGGRHHPHGSELGRVQVQDQTPGIAAGRRESKSRNAHRPCQVDRDRSIAALLDRGLDAGDLVAPDAVHRNTRDGA